MALSNAEIAERFASGKERGKACNLHIIGDDLYSYDTIVARRLDDTTVAVNPKKYSRSTSRQVREVVWKLRQAGYEPTGEVITPPRSGSVFFDTDYRSNIPFEVYKKVDEAQEAA